jgi:Tfp pilus assembly protein PilF
LAATRAERLRLGVIADDLATIKLELARESAQSAGDHIEALHSRAELLAQQGLALLREHEISANSSECRAIAFMLDQAGFADNADEVWRLANKKADSEGDIQALFAARDYGYFLLRLGRRDEAHKRLNSGS